MAMGGKRQVGELSTAVDIHIEATEPVEVFVGLMTAEEAAELEAAALRESDAVLANEPTAGCAEKSLDGGAALRAVR